jgi:hypothetical protein
MERLEEELLEEVHQLVVVSLMGVPESSVVDLDLAGALGMGMIAVLAG